MIRGAFTRDAFARAVVEESIDPRAFAIEASGDECYVLLAADGGWEVFYSERGLKSDLRRFATEAAGLEDLLARLRADPSTRLPGAKG